VIDAPEAPSHQEHHGQELLCHQLGALRHHEERGGEGQDRRPYLRLGFYQVSKH
jgi:hypothetical protein